MLLFLSLKLLQESHLNTYLNLSKDLGAGSVEQIKAYIAQLGATGVESNEN